MSCFESGPFVEAGNYGIFASMIVGTGIDVVEVPRVAAAIERFGDRFLQRIFTQGEIRYCQ